MNEQFWTYESARSLATLLENIAPKYGCHIALTGGCLYKPGERKDCDVIVYQIRQADRIDKDGLFAEMAQIGFEFGKQIDWLQKVSFRGKSIDLLFPNDPFPMTNFDCVSQSGGRGGY